MPEPEDILRYAMEDAAFGHYLYAGDDLSLASIAVSLKRIADRMGCPSVPGPQPEPAPSWSNQDDKPLPALIDNAKTHGWSLIVKGHCYACDKPESECGCLPF